MNVKKMLSMLMLLTTIHMQAEMQRICSGLMYEQRITEGQLPLVVHILYADPKQVTIKPVHATGKALSRESVSSIVERTGALAGINGAFFRRGGRFNGNSLRILKIDKAIYSDPQYTSGALMWGVQDNALIDKVNLTIQLNINGKTYPVNRINQPRAADEAVLYTSEFGYTTLTDNKGTEIHIGVSDNNGSSYQGVQSITRGGNSEIDNMWVYSVGPLCSVDLQDIKENIPVSIAGSLHTKTHSFSADQQTYIVSAMPIILQNKIIKTKEEMMEELTAGKKLTSTPDEVIFNPESEGAWLIDGQHPRTAVGIQSDGTWVLVAVEGRQPTRSIGMSLFELAELFKSLDCTDAINLGGGGDSTMIIDGVMMNVPSGSSTPGSAGYQQTQERPVSDTICIYQKIS